VPTAISISSPGDTISLPQDREPHQDPDWLAICRQKQDEMYPREQEDRNKMGVWELDLHHQEHECYNAHLFTYLEESSDAEQKSAACIYGRGTVAIHTLYDKESTDCRTISIPNVKFILQPQDTNHRLGAIALPEGTHLHLPNLNCSNHGDGFLSFDDSLGCALGRLSQGGRKFWSLRTYDPPITTPAGPTSSPLSVAEHTSMFGTLNLFGKRGRNAADDQVTSPSSHRSTLLTFSNSALF